VAHRAARRSRADQGAGRGDDPGRNVTSLIVPLAVVAELVVAIAIIGHGHKVQNPVGKREAYVLGLLAVRAGWFLVHPIYTFRSRHLYWYDDDGEGTACGGITFPAPSIRRTGTSPISPSASGHRRTIRTPVTEIWVRREMIAHSIISFADNSVIVGLVINLRPHLRPAGRARAASCTGYEHC
jgi:uncharacterized membrane protein